MYCRVGMLVAVLCVHPNAWWRGTEHVPDVTNGLRFDGDVMLVVGRPEDVLPGGYVGGGGGG